VSLVTPRDQWPLSGRGAVTDRTVTLNSVATGWIAGVVGSVALAIGMLFWDDLSFRQSAWVTLGLPPALGVALGASSRLRRLALGVVLGWSFCVLVVALGAVTAIRGF
jgi:hypothetical protein